MALLEKGVEFEHKIVDLQNKPEDFVELYASLHPDPSARAKVPILEHCTRDLEEEVLPPTPSTFPTASSLYDVQVIESNVCAEYIAEAFPDQGHSLLPTRPPDKANMRLLGEIWQTSGMGSYFPILLAARDGDQARLDQELTKLKAGMVIMDRLLCQYGADPAKTPFFLESGFCLGEVCLAPFVQRLLVTVPHWVGVDVLDMAEEEGCRRLRRWMQALAERPSTVASGGSKEETIKNFTRLLEMMKPGGGGAGAGGGAGGATGSTSSK